jgi:hypothetical protein
VSTWDEIGEVLEQAIWRATRGGTLPMLMASIKGAGTVQDGADRVGVDRRTWQRWNTGSRPKPATMRKIRNAAARARGPALARAQPKLKVSSRYPASKDSRTERVLDAVGLNWRPGFMRQVLDLYNAGNMPAAARAFIGAIEHGSPDGSAFYRDWLTPAEDRPDDDEEQGFDLDGIIW